MTRGAGLALSDKFAAPALKLALPPALTLRAFAAATAVGMRGLGGGTEADDSALSDMMSPRSVMSDEVMLPGLGLIAS